MRSGTVMIAFAGRMAAMLRRKAALLVTCAVLVLSGGVDAAAESPAARVEDRPFGILGPPRRQEVGPTARAVNPVSLDWIQTMPGPASSLGTTTTIARASAEHADHWDEVSAPIATAYDTRFGMVYLDDQGRLWANDGSLYPARKVTPKLIWESEWAWAQRTSKLGGMVITPAGAILVADRGMSRILRVTCVTRGFEVESIAAGLVAGGFFGGALDGALGSAEPWQPAGLAVDRQGTIYFTQDDHRLRKIEASRVLTTIAGDGTAGFSDGEGKSARLNGPAGVTVGLDGNVYVCDTYNHAIRRIEPDGKVSTVAGNGHPGHADGSGREARFHSPTDLVLDPDGNLLVADTGSHAVRRVSPDGSVATVAGSGKGYRDGPGNQAQFNNPRGLWLAADSGVLFVADRDNLAIRAVRVSRPRTGAPVYLSPASTGDARDGAN